MDPNANLAEQEAIMARSYGANVYGPILPSLKPRLRELRLALAQWLRRGGFEPDWSKAPNARKYYGK